MRKNLMGPGHIQVWHDGERWVDNWPQRNDMDPNPVPAPNGGRHKSLRVDPGSTVRQAIDFLNHADDRKSFFDTYTQVVGKTQPEPVKPKPVAVRASELWGAPQAGVASSFRPYVEGLTKDQVIAFLNEGAAELIRRDLREKEAEETNRRNTEYEAKRQEVRHRNDELALKYQRERNFAVSAQGLSNFMTGVVHALGIQRQLFRQEYKHPDPSPDPIVAGGKQLKTGADWTALDIAKATKAYKSAKVRKKSNDPVDAKPPWEREAKEHIDFKLRQAAAPGGWNVKKEEPVKAPPVKPHVNFPGTFTTLKNARDRYW